MSADLDSMGVVGTMAAVLTAATVVATGFAAFARHFWIADLASHFRVQYVGAAVLGGILLAGSFRSEWTMLAAAACILLSVIASASVLRRASAAPGTSADSLRVATINTFYRNPDCARVVGFIRDECPDVVVLQEVTPRSRRALAVLEHDYPHQYFAGDAQARGVLLLSRWPIERAESLGPNSSASLGVRATLRVRRNALHVLGIHACWPMGRAKAALRNRQLAQLAELAKSGPAPFVVLGDLNVSPFSPHFQAMLETGGLKSAAQGFGWQPTWPSVLPPAGIQIDHVLVSRDVEVRRFARGPFIGSDHWPVVVDIVLE